MPPLTGVGAGGHGGGEGGAVRPVVDQAALQFEREMPLGAADQDRFEEFAEGLVGDLGGDPETADLLLVLDDPLLLHREAQIGQPEARGGLAHGTVPGHGQIVLLDGERIRASRGREARGGDHRVPVRDGQEVDPERLVGPPVGGFTGRGAGAEQNVLAGAEQQHGAGRRSAREIADVGGAGDQGGRGARGGAPVAEQPASDGVHL